LSGNIVSDVGLGCSQIYQRPQATLTAYSSYIKPLHPSFPPSERLSTLPRQTVK
ncbi:hypothetical protein QBC45DRAFT_299019, partial [Copromyces sp. CBS 386.78]